MWPFNRKRPNPKSVPLPLAETARHAGFFAAHAVWCVSDGETLIPMVAYPSGNGKASMTRLVSDDSQKAVADVKARLRDEAVRHGAALVIYDSFVTLGAWRTDAIVVEAITDSSEFVVAIPYRNANSSDGFAVYKPKFIQCPSEAVEQAAQSFFDGVDGHQKGNEVWSKYIDQSK